MEQLVDAAFKSHETFRAWHLEFSRSVPRFKSEFELYCDRRRHTPNDADESFSETRRCDSDDFDEEVEKTPRFSAVPLLKRQCCRAYADIKNRDFESASELLEEAREQIKFCIENKCLREEYEGGFEYVVKSLELYCSFKDYGGDSWGKKKCKGCVKHLKSFEELNSKEKAAVLSVKSYFVRYICSDSYEAYDEQIQICTKLIDLDGDNLEWYIDAYHPREKKRNSCVENSKTCRGPGEDEVKIITDAVKCTGAEFDPNVQALFISCLAQYFKQHGYPLRFGTEQFKSNEQVVSFIKSKADRIIALDPMYAGSNSYLRKVFLRHLPYKFQDVKFAWLCAKRALIFRPKSLRVNHGLASIYIKMGMYQKGEIYLWKAYRKDDRCVNAALDLVHIWLRNPSAHTENFTQIFKELLRNPSISEFERSRIFFARAIQKFVSREVKEAAEDFYEAFYCDKEAAIQEIKAIQGVIRRFKWTNSNNCSQTLISGLADLFTSRAEDWPEGTRAQIEAFKTMASALPNTDGADQEWRTKQFRKGFARPRESLNYSGSSSNNWRDVSGWSFESAPTNMPWRSVSSTKTQYFWAGSSNNAAIIWLPSPFPNAPQRPDRNGRNQGQSQSYQRHIESRDIAAAREILGLPQQNVPEEALNAAYENIVRSYNPDKNRELLPKDHERKIEYMIRVNKAWETLQLRFCYP